MKQIILILCLLLGSQVLLAQEAKIMFWVEDAVGNKDTVFYYQYDIVSKTNLYNVPASNDLDLRFVIRTDTNNCITTNSANATVIRKEWLCGCKNNPHNNDPYIEEYGWVHSLAYNGDFKQADEELYYCGSFGYMPLKLFAVHYPVKIYLKQVSDGILPGLTYISFHNYENGKLLDYDSLFYKKYSMPNNVGLENNMYYYDVNDFNSSVYYADTLPLFIINEPSDNIILFKFMPTCIGITEQKGINYKHNIFPNPSGSYIVIDGDEVDYGNYRLYDIQGHKLYSFIIDNIPYQLDISDLPSGTYILRGDTFYEQFIKGEK